MKLDGTYPNMRGSEVLGIVLRQGIRQAVHQVCGCYEDQVWREQMVQAEREELLGESSRVSSHWLGESSFPSLDG